MENALTPETIEILRQAQEKKNQLASLGLAPVETKPETEKLYENFVEIKNLPSRGLFYKNKIMGQALKVEDLLQIQNLDEDNINDRFNEIFSRRLRGIDPNEILSVDELYFALWLRESSYPGYTFPHPGYDCPKCKFEVPSDIAEFGFEALSIKTNLDDIMKLYGGKEFVDLTLPNGSKYQMKIKKRSDDFRVKNILHRDYYQYDRTPPDGIPELMTLLAVSDFGIPDLREMADKFKTFSAIDFNEYLKNYKKYSLTSEITVNLTCPKCKEVVPIQGYPFRFDIYFPYNT